MDDKVTICPNCKEETIPGWLPPDDEIDFELAEECGYGDFIAFTWEETAIFHFVYDATVCEECGGWYEYGEAWYYNEETNNYDLTRDQVLSMKASN